MVVQILSGIHGEQLFFSIKEKAYLTGIWMQDHLKILTSPCSTMLDVDYPECQSSKEILCLATTEMCVVYFDQCLGAAFLKAGLNLLF